MPEYWDKFYINAAVSQGYYKVKPEFIFIHFIAENEVENVPSAPWDGIHYAVPKEMFLPVFDVKIGEWKTPNETDFEEIRAEFTGEIERIINFCLNSAPYILPPCRLVRGIINLKHYYAERSNINYSNRNFSKNNRDHLSLKGYNPVKQRERLAVPILWGQQFIKHGVIEDIVSRSCYCFINPLFFDFCRAYFIRILI